MQFIFESRKHMGTILMTAAVAVGMGLALALYSVGAKAQEDAAGAENSFALKGLGQATCNQYLQERGAESGVYGRFMSWTQGYLSAYNQMQSDTVDIMPWQSTGLQASLITEYCKQNREARYFQAVAWLVAYWRDDRLQSRSEAIEVTANDRTITIYTEILRRAQEALSERGHYDGPIDGEYGDGTRAAFQAFQKANNLQQTGLPDQRSLFALFRGGDNAAPASTDGGEQ